MFWILGMLTFWIVVGFVLAEVEAHLKRKKSLAEQYIDTVSRHIYGDGSPGVTKVHGGGDGGPGWSRKNAITSISPLSGGGGSGGGHIEIRTTCDEAAAGTVHDIAIREALSCGREVTSDALIGGSKDD